MPWRWITTIPRTLLHCGVRELEEWAGLSWPILTPRGIHGSLRPAAGSGTRLRPGGVQQSGVRSHVAAPGLGQQWPILRAGPRHGRPLCSVLRTELAQLSGQDPQTLCLHAGGLETQQPPPFRRSKQCQALSWQHLGCDSLDVVPVPGPRAAVVKSQPY